MQEVRGAQGLEGATAQGWESIRARGHKFGRAQGWKDARQEGARVWSGSTRERGLVPLHLFALEPFSLPDI